MLPSLRHAIFTPTTFKPENRISGLELLIDRFSPYTREAGQACQFNSASLRYLSITGNATLRGQSGTGGWWRCGWVYLDSTAASKVINSCLSGNTGYQISANATPALVLSAGDNTQVITATHGSTLSTATWYFVFIYYDGVNIGVSLNDGADVTAAMTTYTPGTAGWNIGADVTPGNYFDGRMQCWGGADGVLTAAQRTVLYNGGTPLAYDQIGGAISQQPTFFYFELNEPTAARLDIGYNAYSLTSNNSVGTAAGTVLNACGQQNNRATGNHFSQATQAKKPVIRRKGMMYDGQDDLLVNATGFPSGASGVVLRLVQITPDTDNTGYEIASSDEATATSYIAFITRRRSAVPNAEYQQQDAADVVDWLRGGTTIAASKDQISVTRSDGSTISARVNQILQTLAVNGGANGGNWFDNTSGRDNVAFGCWKRNVEATFFAGYITYAAVCTPNPASSKLIEWERFIARNYAVALP